MPTGDNLIVRARIAEQAERYTDMAEVRRLFRIEYSRLNLATNRCVMCKYVAT